MDRVPVEARNRAIIVMVLGALIEIIGIGLLVFGRSLPLSVSILGLGTVITALGAVILTRSRQ